MPSNISVVQQALRRIDMDALLSVEEAARKLGGLSKYTIQAWLSSGKLQRTKVGSRTMIRESDLSSVIEVGGKSIRAGSGGSADAA